jgi:hypothetical protein
VAAVDEHSVIGLPSIELVAFAPIASPQFFPAKLFDKPMMPERPHPLHQRRVILFSHDLKHLDASACIKP